MAEFIKSFNTTITNLTRRDLPHVSKFCQVLHHAAA